ncbi:2'-5' RNA ligase family protein [Pontibacter vulgaris]|uniref:2'-5' RNA ligase family protein n=1 Tax=Pontibacter vulgaris TaxID=2905679 RepID=UPI001FA7BC74|nr:2'-5' RNA ligase family protein [Pontibacter vulgaris]
MNQEQLAYHYNHLYQESANKILNNNLTIDTLIDSTTDSRFGITLLIRPNAEVKQNIEKFLEEIRLNEPDQYYYPASDLHVTILSIISCYDGFDLFQIAVNQYSDVIRKSLEAVRDFEIEFKGVTVSDAAVMIQGYPKDESLRNLRENLRENFKQSGLQQSIDQRYSIVTAHITVARFKAKLQNANAFLESLDKYKNHQFGISKVSKAELVYNDWYQRERFVQKLKEFEL